MIMLSIWHWASLVRHTLIPKWQRLPKMFKADLIRLTDGESGWQTDWHLSVVPHSSCVESSLAPGQTALSQQWVVVFWSVTHPSQSSERLIKQPWWAGRGNWISPLKDRPPNPHQQELREHAVHQVSSATVVRPIRFFLSRVQQTLEHVTTV